jgi:phosphatidylserine/phosphatidylglycerophosphate/cardiolipin synthase-like enzyme
MMEALHRMSSNDLRKVSAALRGQRLRMPVTITGLSPYSLSSDTQQLAADLSSLHDSGFNEVQAAVLIEAVIEARSKAKAVDEVVDLVASGPDLPGILNRDTSVVVQQLFREAKDSVLVVGYSVYQGTQVFATLAEQMARKPELDVIMCFNVGRDGNDSRSDYEIRHRYLSQFKKKQWPDGFPLPKLYFDPRAIDSDPSKRASLHAKCIVVDRRYAFVSSANFTERGQKRNIEIGVRVDLPHIAEGISNYILNLIDEQVLEKLV